MSVHVASWAWKQKTGDAGAKLVLVKLAEQANDLGECWPSQKTLAAECEMSRRTVQRKLELLYELELVSATQRTRGNGSDTSLLYRVGPVRQIDAPPCVTGDAPPTTRVTHPEPSSEPRSDASTSEIDEREKHRVREMVERSLGEAVAC